MFHPNFEIVIVGHIDRAANCAKLQRDTGGALFLDDGTLGEWANHERALQSVVGSRKSHVILLQDDAQPVPLFLRQVERAIEQRPRELVSLYFGTGHMHDQWRERQQRAIDTMPRGTSWLESNVLLHAVGLVIPIEDLPDLLSWAKTSQQPTDHRIGLWYKQQGRSVFYTFPSLVDHEDSATVTIHPDGLERIYPRKAFATGKFIGGRVMSHKF